MKNLMVEFTRYSTANKIKLLLVLPLILILTVLEQIFNHGWIFIIIVVALSLIAIKISEDEIPNYSGTTQYEADEYLVKYCHELTNSIIVAHDGKIYGKVDVSESNINKLKLVIAESNSSQLDCIRIENILDEFLSGNYLDAVELHNYCWNILDGTVGLAVGIKDEYK